jgi:hypothetical protein
MGVKVELSCYIKGGKLKCPRCHKEIAHLGEYKYVHYSYEVKRDEVTEEPFVNAIGGAEVSWESELSAANVDGNSSSITGVTAHCWDCGENFDLPSGSLDWDR